jgi:hypothetical protein
MKRNTTALTMSVVCALLETTRALGSTTVVTPSSPDAWTLFQGTDTAAVDFVSGPSTPPAGIGSLEYKVGTNGDDFAEARNTAHAGTKLSALTTLTYWTYVSNNMGCQAAYLILNIDQDNNGTTDDLLFFEPCYQDGTYATVGSDTIATQPAVALNTWQQWDALNGGWWSLNDGTFGPPLHSLAGYEAFYPDATIVNSVSGNGGLRIAAGGGAGAWDNFVGNADDLTIGVSGADTTYDFEPDTFGSCLALIDSATKTITLLSDCTTDHTLHVPNGWTLDGNGHTITAVDPSGGHFVGAVIQGDAGASSDTVKNLHVTTSALADVCDADTARLRGILFDGVGGTIAGNTVDHLKQGTTSGCQEGNAIEVRNPPFDKTGKTVAVTISNNIVSDYQKTGILVNGSVAATIQSNNSVKGQGPITWIAQNGIQIGFGATAKISGNSIRDNYYTPPKVQACGVLIDKAGGVGGATKTGLSYVKNENTFSGNEVDICNFGKGGGFSPNPA